jgi:uncharacterized membrane protein
MQSHAKLLGHSVHQMLIVFPLGLLATSLLFDLAWLLTDSPAMASTAWWLQVAGLIGGAVAAPFGTIDWLAIPAGTRAKRVGAVHGGGNVLVMLLFLLSAWMRREHPSAPAAIDLLPSFLGGGLALVTAWLGGELVARHAVGVYDDAGLDASSSLHRVRH